jgi:hypothetical protein
MPLKTGKSPKVVSANISEMVRSYGKTKKIGTSKPESKAKAVKQATAIALEKAGKSKEPKAGSRPKGVPGPFMTVKKKDGNRPVKIY